MTLIAVCTPTFKRPEFLRGLLESLVAMNKADMDVKIIVVDNDAAGSAKDVIDSFSNRLPGIVYAIEPDRGIASARNRLVAIAMQFNADYVAFVDDDEWLNAEWLSNLIDTANLYGADAVAGPVLPHYDPGIPNWMINADLFDERGRRPTGTPIRILGMGNQLIRCDWLGKVEGPFNKQLALTGGEDPYLWGQLFHLGLNMIWCDEAEVYERIPRTRASVKWLLMRQFNYGIAGSRVIVNVESSLSARAMRIVKCVFRIAQGSVLLPFSILRGRATALKSGQHIFRGVGGLLGMMGFQYHEYKKTHGR